MLKTKVSKILKLIVKTVDSIDDLQYKRIIWGGSHRYSFSLDNEFISSEKERGEMATYRDSIMHESRAFPCVVMYTDMNDKYHYLFIEKYYE